MDLNTIDVINDIPFLAMANPTYKPISWYGSVDSEGDAAMETQLIRASEGIDGTGVVIGVMSDSFDAGGDGFESVVENGDLPGPGNPNGYTTPVTILADSAEGANEGRAMAEIIHDVAPGAGLVFYSAFLGPTAFAEAFTALAEHGADIIFRGDGGPGPAC
jgi:hypothetical protein